MTERRKTERDRFLCSSENLAGDVSREVLLGRRLDMRCSKG